MRAPGHPVASAMPPAHQFSLLVVQKQKTIHITCTHTYIHTYIACIHTSQACMHHIHTYIQTDRQTCRHTYIYAYMRQGPRTPPGVRVCQNHCISYGNTIISARTNDVPMGILSLWTRPGSRGLIGFDELTIGHVRPAAPPVVSYKVGIILRNHGFSMGNIVIFT